ncbi:asb105 [Agrotis segetum nucleopolyhedrovirus B]|uniref:Asb105 n=1 Tax=Agrotis segetum nucleopolyhedrovirus B TaxID=1580580 RepID=A0A0A7KRH3_9ABAC|nr:asb105 [Agrotis segetum nucleopolyhedrovirus B]AIZ48662.1 asb105 [Agrotis segetum nucleopolyhedrovirus B]
MYNSITELPASTQVLPFEGKRIYMKFFNRAYEKYHSDAAAARIAWQAVKRKYTKVNDEWVPRRDANEYDTTTTEEEEEEDEDGYNYTDSDTDTDDTDHY